MDKEGALAAVAILVLSGVLVYGYRRATAINADNKQKAVLSYEAGASQAAIESEILYTGTANAYNSGAAMYVANTPFLFQAPIGNTIPSSSVSNVPYDTSSGIAISQSL